MVSRACRGTVFEMTKRLMHGGVHYNLQKLEFQNIGIEVDGHFRTTRTSIWQGDRQTLGLQTHQQILKACGRGGKKTRIFPSCNRSTGSCICLNTIL